MLTKMTVQLPAANGGVPSVTAVDTGQGALPIAVQSALPQGVSRREPYLQNGRVFVDFSNAASTAVSLDVIFLPHMKHFL